MAFIEIVIPAQAGKRAIDGEFRGTAIQPDRNTSRSETKSKVDRVAEFISLLDSRFRGNDDRVDA